MPHQYPSEFYTKTNWKNEPDTSTPLGQANLNHIEQGIKTADERIYDLDGRVGVYEDYEDVIVGYKNAAQASAQAAATSETNASTSATASANSATASANSASDSASSASDSASSASDAHADAINAATSAANALSSEQAAATSESNAATSESNASSSATAASNSATAAASSASNASASEANASASETAAATSKRNAEDFATLSESYAKGGTNTRQGEDTDNAKYYKEQAETTYGQTLKIKDSITFANLPTTGLDVGDAYKITNAFVTDNRFAQGAGISVSANSVIYWSEDSLWELFSTGTFDSSALIDMIYPIGSIYITTNSANPSTYWPGTSWDSWGAGRVPIGVDTTDADFDTVEETGGNKTHTLSTDEMPSHTHTFTGTAANHDHTFTGSSSTTASQNTSTTGTVSAGHTHTFTTGGISANHTHSFSSNSAGYHRHSLMFASEGGSRTSAKRAWYRGNISDSDVGDDPTSVNYDGTHVHSGTTGNVSSNHTHSGTTDGISANHTHSYAHTHTVTASGTVSSKSITPSGTNSSTGGGNAFSTMNPYITCYMWKRVEPTT